jgi:hypothetical protein
MTIGNHHSHDVSGVENNGDEMLQVEVYYEVEDFRFISGR